MEQQFLTVPEVARLLDVDRTTVWDWTQSGYIQPATRAGRIALFTQEEVERVRELRAERKARQHQPTTTAA